jgi:3-oxoacyl-[acyl-carrier protein] reductase
MNLHLTGRIALVAGSSRGIGKAIAKEFLAEGCRTIITGRETATLAQTASEFEETFGADRLMTWPGDLTKADRINELVAAVRQRWGVPDCVIANIGSGRGKPGWALTEDDWQAMFDVNLWGSVRLAGALLPMLTEVRRGSFVFITSITGVESTPAPLPYSAAKAALINLSKNMARLAAPFGVRVNCVAPGNILFPGGSWARRLVEREEETRRYINAEVPLQRFGTPEEVAAAVVFLSSERAAFITGACLIPDGGQTRSV